MASASTLWSHRLAWLMAALALLPIGLGAVVTTVEAGMAFADWPTSDGYPMLSYPWLKSSGDKFLEHGHRLAGMLIGFVSLVFAGWTLFVDRRPVLRRYAAIVLAGVVVQGIVGGLRVRLDRDDIALLHGIFAAWVFTAMCLTVLASGNAHAEIADRRRPTRGLQIASAAALACVLVQSVLGGRLRHLGSSDAWLIHPWFAVAVVVSALWLQFLTGRQELPRIQTTVQCGLWLVFAQTVLGIFTWGAKYGYPQWDILAERLSPAQVALSSLHQVVGLLTFASVAVAFVQIASACRHADVVQAASVPEGASFGNVSHAAGGAG